MDNLGKTFEDACKSREIQGAVLMAWSKNGFGYENTFGVKTVKDGAPEEPLQPDTVFWIASCTKLMTSIAVLQCVQRGLVGLDDDVSKWLPDLAAEEVLVGFDGDTGKAQTEKRKTPIKVKHLLSHQSGLLYDAFDPTLIKYRKSRNEPINGGTTVIERHLHPLNFEPGSSWGYSPGLDFAGKLVERITGKNSLEDYMRENLWAPLGIKDITFFPEKRPDMMERMSGMSVRDPKGSGKVVHYDGPLFNTIGADDCFGGSGCYATVPEYMKILKSILLDDGKLLNTETSALLFQPQLSKASHDALDQLRDVPGFWNMVPGFYTRAIQVDYGCGGMITMEGEQNWRRKGTLSWSGLPNLFWWVDREAGLCGIYGGQVIPPGDQKTRELTKLFDQAMYEGLVNKKANL